MYIEIKPEKSYVAAYIPSHEMHHFRGKNQEEVNALITKKISDVVDVTRLPYRAFAFYDGEDGNDASSILAQWVKLKEGVDAKAYFEKRFAYCECNYKKWFDWPLL